MQNTQEINWTWEIIRTFLPIAITIGVGFWLSRRTENYKKDLSKELENYKLQLQSSFRTQFFQFQTKFSALHQEQAKVIKELFALLVDVNKNFLTIEKNKEIYDEKTLLILNVSEEKKTELPIKSLSNLMDSFNEFSNFYSKNRIFLSLDICESINKLIDSSQKLIQIHLAPAIYKHYIKDEFKAFLSEDELNNYVKELNSIKSEDITTAIHKLEIEFRKLIEVKPPTQRQIELINKKDSSTRESFEN